MYKTFDKYGFIFIKVRIKVQPTKLNDKMIPFREAFKKNNGKQAGAELGQAQFKLGLAKVAIAM